MKLRKDAHTKTIHLVLVNRRSKLNGMLVIMNLKWFISSMKSVVLSKSPLILSFGWSRLTFSKNFSFVDSDKYLETSKNILIIIIITRFSKKYDLNLILFVYYFYSTRISFIVPISVLKKTFYWMKIIIVFYFFFHFS